jgi:hypothetical protein
MLIPSRSFTTQAPAAGAIVVEWNVAGSAPGHAGTWDTHIRIGGAAGTNTGLDKCAAGTADFASCSAAFLSLHLTKTSSAYFEGLWQWIADHAVEDPNQNQTSVFAGRGILSESQGPVWLIGTASEHAGIYQYSLVNARNHYMGLIQTESVRSPLLFRETVRLMIEFQPYYQPMASVSPGFSANVAYYDPSPLPTMAWGLTVESSSNIFIFGAGHYAVRSLVIMLFHVLIEILQFFQNYNGTCVNTDTCQSEIVNIDSASSVALYQLATVGVTQSLSIDQQGEVHFINMCFSCSLHLLSCPRICSQQRGDAVHHHVVDQLMTRIHSVRRTSAGALDLYIALCTLVYLHSMAFSSGTWRHLGGFPPKLASSGSARGGRSNIKFMLRKACTVEILQNT